VLGLENELERLQHERKVDTAAREQAEQEVLDVRRGREELETVVEQLEQQHRNLKIEKTMEVELLTKQVQSLNARAAHTANTQFTILQVTLTLKVMKCKFFLR
jgi:hypothetical protein